MQLRLNSMTTNEALIAEIGTFLRKFRFNDASMQLNPIQGYDSILQAAHNGKSIRRNKKAPKGASLLA